MIASVARVSGRPVREVAADSYALTLYTHLMNQDAEYLAALTREDEEIRFADTLAVAFNDPKQLKKVAGAFKARLASMSPQPLKSVEQLAAEADDLWALHHRSDKKRPVS